MENTPSTPLLPLLLGPLEKRPLVLFNFDHSEIEDKPFIEGLNRALDEDIQAGRMDPETLMSCAARATLYMATPRRGPAKNGTITPASWPKPGEDWREVEHGDGRERLLARMVHHGLDPWANPLEAVPGSEMLGDTFASTWVSYGYPNLMRMTLGMGGGEWDPNQIASRRETHFGQVPTLLQAAVMQDLTDIVAAGIEMGGSTAGLLHRAKSPEMVKLLIGAGCKVSEIVDPKAKTDVIKHWLGALNAKTARSLIEVAQDQISPHDRFEQAALGGSWAPLSDAIAAWPEWVDATSRVGRLQIRTPLMLLMRAERRNADRIKQALRLLAKAPADDREIAPGLTEMSLYRLTLARLNNESSHSNSVSSDRLGKQLNELFLRSRDGGDAEKLLNADAQAVLHRAEGMLNTASGRRLGRYLLQAQRVLPHERAKDPISAARARTVEDLVNLGRVAKLCMGGRGMVNIDDSSCLTMYGCMPSMLKAKRTRHGDTTFDWIDRLIGQHPERIDEIATACLSIVSMSMTVNLTGPGTNEDPWKRDIERVERLLDCDARPQWSAANTTVLQTGASNNYASAYAKVFAGQIQGRMERCELAVGFERANPLPSSGSSGPGRRL